MSLEKQKSTNFLCAKKKKINPLWEKYQKISSFILPNNESPIFFPVHVLGALDADLQERLSLGSRRVFSHGASCPHENEERRGSTDVHRATHTPAKVLTPAQLSVPSR